MRDFEIGDVWEDNDGNKFEVIKIEYPVVVSKEILN